jgi:hypothetical protein
MPKSAVTSYVRSLDSGSGSGVRHAVQEAPRTRPPRLHPVQTDVCVGTTDQLMCRGEAHPTQHNPKGKR